LDEKGENPDHSFQNISQSSSLKNSFEYSQLNRSCSTASLKIETITGSRTLFEGIESPLKENFFRMNDSKDEGARGWEGGSN
jgi:hypothetical protein